MEYELKDCLNCLRKTEHAQRTIIENRQRIFIDECSECGGVTSSDRTYDILNAEELDNDEY